MLLSFLVAGLIGQAVTLGNLPVIEANNGQCVRNAKAS